MTTPGLASAFESVPASDFVAAAFTLGGALGILQFFDELAKRDLVEKVPNYSWLTICTCLYSRSFALAFFR